MLSAHAMIFQRLIKRISVKFRAVNGIFLSFKSHHSSSLDFKLHRSKLCIKIQVNIIQIRRMSIHTLAAVHQWSPLDRSLSHSFFHHIVCNSIANLHIQAQLHIHILRIFHQNIKVSSSILFRQFAVCTSALNGTAY